MPGMNEITIFKCDPNGKILWKYQGTVLSHAAGTIVIEATFNREDMPFQGIVLKTNDRFIETFHTDRWYNIFEIHDRDDGSLKGWYCNIGRPAIFKDANKLLYDDLALDLWVTPDGEQFILDEDEFADLDLDESTRAHALEGLMQLQEYFYHKFRDRRIGSAKETTKPF
jgi:protein associated with RNAse G/E